MSRKINYIYTFKLPPHPKPVDDERWRIVLTSIITNAYTGYGQGYIDDFKTYISTFPEDTREEIFTELQLGVNNLMQQPGIRLLEDIDETTVCGVLAYTFVDGWAKLIITINEDG